jgi:hypothetical protein
MASVNRSTINFLGLKAESGRPFNIDGGGSFLTPTFPLLASINIDGKPFKLKAHVRAL